MKTKGRRYLPSFSPPTSYSIPSKILHNGFLFTSYIGTCRYSETGLKVWGIYFFLAHAKHHMQQPHAEVFETQIGRSGSQKLCFEACLQRVLSKKVFLLLIKKALSFSILFSVLDNFPKLLFLMCCGETNSCFCYPGMVLF